ncbi:ATP-binding protein [Candidatus Nitronereus thalassa]|uniref:histidine kinase n=1 Tax=Candidatus Nitronereus thalassa TaxID=3020898 RepID=A0ABU3K9A6_9BACT|nr:ATP-binding protein [Candidatus Nitronereus thalassa]MDT7042986.1 ATP-binding protein [Candidatus Nitronereus thalassa]
MNPFALAGFLTSISSLVFGFFVFSRNPTRRFNQLWLAFTMAVALWGLGSIWIALESDPSRALLAWRIAFAVSVIWIPIVFLHFTCVFSGFSHPRLLMASYFGATLFVPLILTSPHFFSGVRFVFASFYYSTPGPLLFTFFTVGWLGLICYSHFLLVQAFRQSSDAKRAQIKYFFIATAVGYAGGSLEFLPIFGFDLYPWGHFAIPFYPIIMAYAIVKYRLMDTSIVLEKGLSYLTLFFVAAIPAFGILLWAQHLYFGSISYPFSATMLVIFHFLVLGSYTIKTRAEEAIGRKFFKERYETAHTLSQFSKALVSILDFRTLTEEIIRTLKRVMAIRHATLYIWDKQKNLYTLVAPTQHPITTSIQFGNTHELPIQLRQHHEPLVREELEDLEITDHSKRLSQNLKALGVEVCLPFLNIHNQLIGFCMLGSRHTGTGYSTEDLQLLTTLGRNAAIALENALLYEDLKQSQSLIQRNNQLRSLEIMAGGFAHEIRNPLTSIKTFVHLAPHRIGDHDFLRHFGRIVTEDVTRIERLCQEVLQYSHHPVPQFFEEDIHEIIDSCLYSTQVKANGKQVQIKKIFAEDLPPIRLDRQQLKQVFLNIFFNALEAMHGENQTLTVRTYWVHTPTDETWAQIEISDSGHGIGHKELEHIFDPFFTTKHESQEHEGTGLGLAIAHQIIQAHGGHIEVNSQIGLGTTFLITLPIPVSSDPQQMAFSF